MRHVTLLRAVALVALCSAQLGLTSPTSVAVATDMHVASSAHARSSATKHQYQVGDVNSTPDYEIVWKHDATVYLPKYGGPEGKLQGNAWIINDADYLHAGHQFVYVEDEQADGMRVGLQWKTADRKWGGLCVHSNGKDGQGNASGILGVSCNITVPEGKRVRYRLGVCDNDVKPCGTVKNWWKKLDHWAWTTIHKPPKAVHGWWDYSDDAGGDDTGDCDESMDSTDC